MANVTYTVPNKNGSYDGDMVVKQYTSLTINAGDTVTVDQPCRGLLIYVSGNCVINGTLSMTQRGANADPTSSGGSDSNTVSSSGLRFPFIKSGSSSSITTTNTLLNGCGNDARSVIANHPSLSSNGIIFTVARSGGSGGSSVNSGGNFAGNSGSTGSNSCGGGGSGGGRAATSGSGAAGTCFSGGAGGGAAHYGRTGGNGGANGGAGGTGDNGVGTNEACGGGCGNPGGYSGVNAGGRGNGPQAPSGMGGLLCLFVGGNLTIGSSGRIESNGNAGAGNQNVNSSYASQAGGGGGGGGRIIIAYRGSLSNSGTIEANGGAGGSYDGGWTNANGGSGANGAITGPTVVA